MSRLGWLLASIGILNLVVALEMGPLASDQMGLRTSATMPLYFWPLASIGFAGTAIMFKYQSSVWSRATASLLFILFFSYYFFLYEGYGSDFGGIAGVMTRFSSSGGGTTESIGAYSAWPLFFILTKSMTMISGLSTTVALKNLFLSMIIILSLSITMLFRRCDESRPIMPAATFVISTYVLLNWQVAPQTFAFVILTLFLGTSVKGIRRLTIGLTLFIACAFAHGFVSLWFIGTVIAMQLSARKQTGINHEGHPWINCLLLIEFAVVIFFAHTYLKSFYRVLVELVSPSLTTGAPLPTIARSALLGLPFQSEESAMTSAIKIVAIISIVIVAVLIADGFRAWIRSNRQRGKERAMLFTASAHIGLGSFLPILGSRGVQLAGLALSNAPCYSGRIRGNAAFSIFLVAVILFSVNLNRINATSTLYMDEEDLESSSWLTEHIEPTSDKQTGVVASGEMCGYLVSAEGGDLDYVSPRLASSMSERKIALCYLMVSPEYLYELNHVEFLASAILLNVTLAAAEESNRIIDTGDNAVYQVIGFSTF